MTRRFRNRRAVLVGAAAAILSSRSYRAARSTSAQRQTCTSRPTQTSPRHPASSGCSSTTAGTGWTGHRSGNAPGLRLDGSLSHFMGHRFGLFSYATLETGGHVDFDHYLLSDTLTAEGKRLDTSALDAAIAYADTLDKPTPPNVP
jgi:hypothetical protein